MVDHEQQTEIAREGRKLPDAPTASVLGDHELVNSDHQPHEPHLRLDVERHVAHDLLVDLRDQQLLRQDASRTAARPSEKVLSSSGP